MKTLQPGQQIDNLVNGITYSIEAHLATGGFGAAYRARKLGGKRGEPTSVCLKLTDDARSWHGESYFAALLSDFAHAVTMYDAFPTEIRVGRAKKLVFAIEMELIDSGTVARAADEGRLGWTEQRVAKKMRGLLQPLQALHNMQVSHRDITPNNVFIGNRAQLKLGDLGIAKAGLKAQGARLESSAPMYFLPRDVGVWWRPADDMYQVGLLMMTLLTGEDIGNDFKVTDANQVTSKTFGLREPLKDCLRVRARRLQNASELLARLP